MFKKAKVQSDQVKVLENVAITTLTCRRCGEQVSGPDAEAVAETMKRHTRKQGHLLGARRG